MQYNNKAKEIYWNHFLVNSVRPKGATDRRLELIKQEIFNDSFFWDDVIARHGNHPIPSSIPNKETYEHCEGNFWGMIMQTLIENGHLKTQTRLTYRVEK